MARTPTTAPKTEGTTTNTKPAKPQPPRVAPQLTSISSIIPMPERTSNRGSKTNYPFGSLNVGQCFGVKNKTVKQLASILSNQNKKTVNKLNPDGSPVYKTVKHTNADGSTTEVPTTEIEQVAKAHFFAIDVTGDLVGKIKGTELEGSSVLVYRDK